MTETPQLYLITPPVFDPQAFAPRLAAVLDAHPVACLRLTLATTDETDVTRVADALLELALARDVPLVITAHLQLVEKLGLDGVHLTDGARSVRKTRKELGADPIVGAFCAVSSHEGMTAGEAGADYIAFGPAGDSALGDGTRAGHDLFAWWSEMIELPVVAEGALDAGLIETLAPVVDFFAIGEEIWREDDAAASLSRLTAPLR
ncbi:MAG: thiamine phosphate synthase [Roseicyclus sp.]|nr:thiamine phosphate synthase [Roseicyclus sp.]